MLDIFWTAFGLGLIFNAAPGAVFAESLRRGISGGFRPAFAVQVGSLVGDALWAILGLAGAAAVLTQPAFQTPLTLVGCSVLGYLGIQGLRSAATPREMASMPQVKGRPLIAGAAMSIGNVWNVVYWGGAGGAVAGSLGSDAPLRDVSVFFIAFMASSILWCFVCAGLIAALSSAVNGSVMRWIEICSSTAIVVFAVVLAGGVL